MSEENALRHDQLNQIEKLRELLHAATISLSGKCIRIDFDEREDAEHFLDVLDGVG